MENEIIEPLTAADILINDINECLDDVRYHCKRATAYLEQNAELFEKLKINEIVKIKKMNGKCMVRMKSKKRIKI